MATKLTEEQKKANAAKRAAAKAKKEAETAEPPVMAAETAEKPAESAPVYQVVAPKEPDVKILYIDSVWSGNEIPIGPGRVITGSGRIFTVPLSQFEGEFQNALHTMLINRRKFIILSGLTEDQRKQYNCDYREGEVIRNEGTFDFLLRCPVEEAARIFRELCKEHRDLVAYRFAEAFENGDNRVTRDRVEALNAISKQDYPDGQGAFTQIIKGINENI